MDKELLATELRTYVQERFLDVDSTEQLTLTSPLLEWGILTSMNTAILLTHIREQYGVQVPPQDVTGHNLGTIDALATLLNRLLAAQRMESLEAETA